jgi:glutamine synthetase
MAKWAWDDTGSSCHVHSSLCDADGRSVLEDHHGQHGMSDTFRWYLGGLLATAREMSLLLAPTINSYKRFQPGSWAPTAVAWGVDNRTLGFRKVGHGEATRVECRIPGSDANSYLAFAATLAGGLHGIRNKIDPGAPYLGNGYEGDDLPRVPASLVEAIELWRGSEVAREAFGDEVHHHILNMAEQEWLESNRCVTDWELRRYFERI